jgi:deoxyribodipyrimidine photo-lyase
MAETAAALADRVHILNDKPVRPDGQYVLYWMQQSQRAAQNHALEAAIVKANQLGLPVVVCFGLMDDYPEATERHYAFMLQGLRDVQAELAGREILFVAKHDTPPNAALHFSRHAAVIVTDRGYLRHLRAWRDEVADGVGCRVVEVDADVVVPIDKATTKDEWAARTLRPRIHKVWKDYLHLFRETKVKHPSVDLAAQLGVKSDFDFSNPANVLATIKCDRGVKAGAFFEGGARAAARLLKKFITEKLGDYGEGRNEPAGDQSSKMSPYLQYGNISPVEVAVRVRDATQGKPEDRDVYIEELIVRRELAHNFCWYNARYDQYEGLPPWARASLEKHAADPRPIVYTRQQLADAQTHDPYWNAAQLEAVKTGFMHNYMRMYWGKKILEWSDSPRHGYETTLWLNNRFFLDGLNANSYGNVGWIYGLHDRAWGPERPIFGLIRYMNAGGLERKFDIDAYIKKVSLL